MEWRAYIKGDEQDLKDLARGFNKGDLVIGTDDVGTYITGPVLEDYQDSIEALNEAERLLPVLNGIGRAAIPGFGTIESTGQIKKVETGAISVQVHATVAWAVRVRAEGQVSINGVPVQDPLPDRLTKLWEASQKPSLEAAITKLGSMTTLNWVDLYKVFELLRKAAGGQAKLSNRSGVTEQRISSFTWNANHPDLSGADARHAVLPGEPKPKDKISIEDGREVIRDLLNGMQAWIHANLPPASANPGR